MAIFPLTSFCFPFFFQLFVHLLWRSRRKGENVKYWRYWFVCSVPSRENEKARHNSITQFNQSPSVHTVTVAPSGPCQRSSASHYDELFNDGTSDQQPTTTLAVWLESNIKIFQKKRALDCNARCDYCPLVIVRAEKNGNDATQTAVKLVKKRVKLFDWLTMTERLTSFFRPFVFELALVCTTDTHRFSRPHWLLLIDLLLIISPLKSLFTKILSHL